jgi:hypothetical protein
MGHSLISLLTLLAAATALQPAEAQTGPSAPWKTELLAPPPVAAPVGFVAAPGVTFVPQVFSEIGYDTNPGHDFVNEKGSAFIRSGAGFALSSVSQTTVANLIATGSMLNYSNNTLFDDPLRFAGTAKGSVAYLVQPGVTASSSAFIDYDGQSINKNQTAGANAELGYSDALLSSVLRGRFLSVEYLNFNGLPATPISLNAAFNYNRSEGTWLGLLGNSWLVSPYAELSAARVDYTDQPKPALVDRSADDFHAKAGVRWTVSPVLYTDIGWRFNQRDTDDHRITSFNSNYFDGSLTWQPSPAFFFKASVERYIGEPSTNFAILADVRSYAFRATYIPVPGVTATTSGGWQIVKDIGSGVHYNAPFADARLAWDYNNHVQFYTALHYQGYDIDWQSFEFNELRIMAGVRIIPDGQDILQGESVESLFARLADARRPLNSELTISGGYSWFGLPDMKMVTIVGGPFFNQALGQQTNGDGSLNGWRTDLRLANFAEGALPDGRSLSFGISGFFANYQGTTNSHCMYSLTTDCVIVNIVDFSPTRENNTGPFGNLNVTANRNVNYWGVALDTRVGWWLDGGLKDGGLKDGGLKDGPPVQALSPFKFGVAVRGIDETAKLTSIDQLVCDPARFKEKVDTRYYGGFVGIERKEPFGDGWIAGIDATAGVYYTSTDFQGRYNGYTVNVPVGFVQESGWVNTSSTTSSFIGTVRLDLKRWVGWGTIGVFGQGEYLSFVPRIVYNNNDQAGGAPFGIIGTQNGTHIASSDAFNFTTGLSLSVPLN